LLFYSNGKKKKNRDQTTGKGNNFPSNESPSFHVMGKRTLEGAPNTGKAALLDPTQKKITGLRTRGGSAPRRECGKNTQKDWGKVPYKKVLPSTRKRTRQKKSGGSLEPGGGGGGGEKLKGGRKTPPKKGENSRGEKNSRRSFIAVSQNRRRGEVAHRKNAHMTQPFSMAIEEGFNKGKKGGMEKWTQQGQGKGQ